MYPSQRKFDSTTKTFHLISHIAGKTVLSVDFFYMHTIQRILPLNLIFWRFVENESGRKKISLSLTQKTPFLLRKKMKNHISHNQKNNPDFFFYSKIAISLKILIS